MDIVKTLTELQQGVEDDRALDFNKDEDRVDFRLRVGDAFANCKASGLREYVRDLHRAWEDNRGRANKPPVRVGQSRAEALRALTDMFMLARQLGEL